MNPEREKDNCRQSSRREWKSKGTNDDINSGSLQRIADALEQSNRLTQEFLNSVQGFQRKNINSMKTKISQINSRLKKIENK